MMHCTTHHGNEITVAQRTALADSLENNLTDAHPRRTLFPQEQAAVNRLPEFFALAQEVSIREVEADFVTAFGDFSGQSLRPEASFIFPSASNALLSTALLLRDSNKSNQDRLNVGMISPVFDNIPGLFMGVGINVEAVSQRRFTDENKIEEILKGKDALVVVSPNNPTGFTLSPEQLEAIGKKCMEAGITLILDSCFHMYKPAAKFDSVEVLERTGVSYAVINDTGKLWALHENKAGILTVSESLLRSARMAHDIMQLSASPTNMLMLTELIRGGGDLAAIMDLTATNRQLLRQALADQKDAALIYPDDETGISVELLEIHPNVHTLSGERSSGLGTSLIRRVSGIHTLALTDFLLDFKTGQDFDPAKTRVALARDPELFGRAAERIGNITVRQMMQVLYDRYF